MKKYKVYYENDPQKETIFCVEARSLDEAIIKASKMKDLDKERFLSIFKIEDTKYTSYV